MSTETAANPYESPGDTAYYTNDLTALPYNFIWRIAWRQGIFGALVLFPIFAIRKLLGLHMPATYATWRLEELELLDESELPRRVLKGLEPFDEICRGCGLRHLGYIVSNRIGWRKEVSSYWLSMDGASFYNATYIFIKVGTMQMEKHVFSCHSKLESGTEIHTGQLDPKDYIPEMVPPGQELESLSPDSTPTQLIEHHNHRIADYSDVVHFTLEALPEHLLHGARKMFEFMVTKGFYVRVPAARVDELKQVVIEDEPD
ncbi:hypothetical protein GC197_06205 [bacterium]|nr:hypothetical protein [bacterium]